MWISFLHCISVDIGSGLGSLLTHQDILQNRAHSVRILSPIEAEPRPKQSREVVGWKCAIYIRSIDCGSRRKARRKQSKERGWFAGGKEQQRSEQTTIKKQWSSVVQFIPRYEIIVLAMRLAPLAIQPHWLLHTFVWTLTSSGMVLIEFCNQGPSPSSSPSSFPPLLPPPLPFPFFIFKNSNKNRSQLS